MPMPYANVSKNKARTFVFYATHVLAYVAPGVAGRIALRMFSTPVRTAPRFDGAFDGAEVSSIGYAGRRLSVWRWKPQVGNGLKVLLVHGWSGSASQFARWVPALTARGYEVVAFDGPAHGASKGARTNLVDFARAVRQVGALEGGLHAVIAHSMGGAATVVAVSEGLRVENLVLLAPPDNVEDRVARFAGWLGLDVKTIAAMKRALAARFGRPLESLRLPRLAPMVNVPALVIHDADDREIPWFEGARTAAALPAGELHTVRGLGHTRILRDEGVIEKATEFLQGAAGVSHLDMRDTNLAAYVQQFEAA